MIWKAFHICKHCKAIVPFCEAYHQSNTSFILLVPFIHKVYGEKLANTEALELLKAMCDRVISCYGDSFKILEDPVRTAAKLGIHEFVREALSQSPELIWSFDEENRHSIFHIAVMYRHEKIFSIIGKLFTHKHPAAALRDKEENNILHLAGRLGPCSEVSGAALHMQRELQWFKVTKIYS